VLDENKGLPGFVDGKASYAGAERTQAALRTIVDKRLLEVRSRPVNLFLHARIGAPAREIVELAEEVEADIVVVGTHGRHGINRLVLGSVAEHVVRDAHCPVLVARPRPDHFGPERDRKWSPEPPCQDCVDIRLSSGGEVHWCELHTKPHPVPHRYSYNDGFRGSLDSYR
ncbi:MAG TPA: universal stress protein, partial [Kofleriaceae bacterium]|nr:universal stress protein [Kofleriaceae bacterium]